MKPPIPMAFPFVFHIVHGRFVVFTAARAIRQLTLAEQSELQWSAKWLEAFGRRR